MVVGRDVLDGVAEGVTDGEAVNVEDDVPLLEEVEEPVDVAERVLERVDVRVATAEMVEELVAEAEDVDDDERVALDVRVDVEELVWVAAYVARRIGRTWHTRQGACAWPSVAHLSASGCSKMLLSAWRRTSACSWSMTCASRCQWS